jgi:methyl-accepting chemotaxis protein
MDLDSAISKHAEWKMKFRNAISKQETLDALSISKDNCCDLGQWLHGEGRKQFGALPSHGTCVLKHAAFHAQAGKVAEAINSKRYAEAEGMLGGGTQYSAASSEVGVSVMRLRKEARI